MDHINVGGINSGPGDMTVSGAVGPNATVYNMGSGGTPVTSAEEYLKRLDDMRRALRREAERGQPDLTLDDAIAALAWLRRHHADQSKPADADQRLTALKRLRKVWTELVEMAKQLPAGVLAGWIVEAMK